MSPIVKPRRTTRAVYAGHGVVVARVDHERRLWRGMKDQHTLVVPHRGAWEFVYRGATYRQAPGFVQLKTPGEMYRDLRRDGPASYDVVVVEPEVVAAAREANRATSDDVFATPQLAAGDPRAAALLALQHLVGRDALAVESAVAEAALALVSLAAPSHAVGHERGPVRRARSYLLERMAERIRLDDVADHVGLDKFHLIRAFRAQVGVPPYEFVTHARVHRARELLRSGVAAGVAATTVGFCDQSQLNRHFVRLVGISPGRYATVMRSASALGRASVSAGEIVGS